ncbi:MAG: hypothetical protein ACK4S4_12865 [Pyrinomonadaceae bacterium]
MTNSDRKRIRRGPAVPALLAAFIFAACGGSGQPQDNGSLAVTTPPTALSQVAASRLTFRYEADVPGPAETDAPVQNEERSAAVQADFDQHRTQEVLDKTVTSPDKKRVLAVYHRVNDLPAEFRLDMYSADGKLLRKLTPDTMAVHFPDTIRWSPDSSAVAFVAMIRAGQADGGDSTGVTPGIAPAAGAEDANAAIEGEANANANGATAPPASPTPGPPVGILTFRTEQIYLANADGDQVKPLTQNEGKIYFYFEWSPDSRMLAAMAATQPEWRAAFAQAESKGEVFVPPGRVRVIEKSGRERLLDDGVTTVHPEWSPDSSKVAAAFEYQIRVYDATGNAPTQAAVPLRNQLLISSQAYDQELQRKAAAENAAAANDQAAPQAPAAGANQPATTLPDPATLVSFSPIVSLEWSSPDILYFQTGYIKEYKNAADNRRSFLRWHRLIFAPQA